MGNGDESTMYGHEALAPTAADALVPADSACATGRNGFRHYTGYWTKLICFFASLIFAISHRCRLMSTQWTL